ncbi:DMSO/selenate family reductase complex A subunit [Shewanella sp. MF05960]|uniref:DMSO/selenate family reductase complex A subunit n=1 Tax=Shewanella sp. MF05960 TaxID=3434874 RepID=UPI003D7AECF5
MQRRDFLKMSAAAGAVSCITACGSKKSETAISEQPVSVVEKTDWFGCTCNCGHACPLRAITQDGVLVRVETDATGNDDWEDHQSRACAKGRSFKRKVYAPDRLKKPMKRIGKRGEGIFEEISWEEAYDIIAVAIKRTVENYGNEAIYPNYGTGRLYSCFSGGHWTQAGQWGGKLLNLTGGFLRQHNTYSSGQMVNAAKWLYGTREQSGYAEIAKSDFYLSFGFNPAETEMSGSSGAFAINKFVKENGLQVVIVDPRYTDTATALDATWLPIRPGTDSALCEALSYEIISRGAADEAFLSKYCIGYDETTLPESAAAGADYKSHILGLGEDGIVKTPEYAAKITGIPVQKIIELADKLIAAEAPFVCQGLGPQRHANGEQNVRSIAMLPLLLGKVGLPGTNTGLDAAINVYPWFFSPVGENPVKASIPCYSWTEAVMRGHDMKSTTDGIRGVEQLPTDIKFIWNYAGNALINQHGDVSKTHEILLDESKCEFILVHDVQMTASAKYADILLPDLTDAEVTDIVANPGTNVGTLTAVTSSITPPVDAKGIFELCLELAKRLGLEEEYSEGRTYQEWVEYSYNKVADANGYPNYDELLEQGIYHVKDFSPLIGLKSFVDDPVANPLNTPSGKIEVYSETLQVMADTWTITDPWSIDGSEDIPAIPKFIKTKEGALDAATKVDYPLQLIGHHTKGRTHSSFGNNSWMEEAVEQAIWLNPFDAKQRGIVQGASVKVTSMRGVLIARARVTPRIMPGVVSLPQGAWLKIENGIDVGGCVNSLTSLRPTAMGKCNPQHTNLVEITLA